ncbi:MAG: hypothetical protein PHO07_09910 [Pirellulales bacterium]|jgi:hypothetical protein|nr:hypothetical protein [Thermoguttaceae bacterium]MDD4787476.1 hypothetical protein [Pirellulales bacterium]MDI9444591.1 hypothetical protein [Planctomycetota bacterium]NLY99745.1 hypothetical protein [Pirellulaceae bacterium]
MTEKHYGYGPWEYRHLCRSCGHAVKAPKNELPCSLCGGDFGVKTSMRKVYLEPEPPPEVVEVEYELEPTFWDRIKAFMGVEVKQRTAIRRENKRGTRRWRWQTHAEVEDESGVMRHDEFLS